MKEWTFNEKQTIVLNCKSYITENGLEKLCRHVKGKISGVNMAILESSGYLAMLNANGVALELTIETVFRLPDISPTSNPFGNIVKTSDTWTHGFAYNTQTLIGGNYGNILSYTSMGGFVGNNPLYSPDTYKEKALKKGVWYDVDNTNTDFFLSYIQITGDTSYIDGTLVPVTRHDFTIENGGQVYYYSVAPQIMNWVKSDTLIPLEKAFPLGVTSPNLTSYSSGASSNIFTPMFCAIVDQQRERSTTFFDAWQFNNQTELRWNNTSKDLTGGMIIDLRIGLEDNDVANSINWKNTGYGYQPVNLTFDMLKDISGQSLRIYPIYVYMRARNVAQEYETDWAYISIDSDGYVSDSGYVSDRMYISLTVHDKGLLPPEQKSDDDKDDENSVDGDTPPSGHTPTSEKEVGLNLLTTTYILSDAQLKEIGNELWSKNFMDNIFMLSNSPIENILSCKIFPTTFSGTASAVKIGNVTMLNGATAQKISASGLSKETGAITFPQKYNSFLDFAPFTNAKIFIPFVGFQPLPVASFIGAELSLRYVFDVVTGAVTVYLLRNGAVFDKYSGICAVDVPMTASNRAQVEVGQIQSAITAGAQLATGNIGGALSAGLSIAAIPNHFNTRGNAGGYTSQYDPRQPYLIIDRPKAQSEITSYGKTNGFPCNLTKTLSTLSGFTSVHDVHLDDVPCLESERQELKSIMQKGFII